MNTLYTIVSKQLYKVITYHMSNLHLALDDKKWREITGVRGSYEFK